MRVNRAVRALGEVRARDAEIVRKRRARAERKHERDERRNPHAGGTGEAASAASDLIISPRILLATNKNGNDTKTRKADQMLPRDQAHDDREAGKMHGFDVRRGFK